jgi:endonuclease/exonuclease/phosphatase (EEP) superfamily protein YafD
MSYGPTLVVFALSLAAEGAVAWWPLELVGHLRPYLLAASALLFIFACFTSQKVVATLALSALLGNGLALRGLVSGAPEFVPRPALLRLVTANVRAGFGQPTDLLPWIAAQDPDLIALVGTDRSWDLALKGPLKAWTHQFVGSRTGGFRGSLYSRYPLDDVKVVDVGGTPALQAFVTIRDARVHYLAIDTPAALGHDGARARTSMFAALEPVLAGTPRAILAGDFKTTPWSPSFQHLRERLGMERAGAGGGLHGTWPTNLGRFGAPLDHVLYRGPFSVIQHAVGPRFGSDHRPLFTVLGG